MALDSICFLGLQLLPELVHESRKNGRSEYRGVPQRSHADYYRGGGRDGFGVAEREQHADHRRLRRHEPTGEHRERADDRSETEDEQADSDAGLDAESVEYQPERDSLESPCDEAKQRLNDQRAELE